MLFKIIGLVLLLCIFCISKIGGLKFRFDYAFSDEANGWLKLHRVPATWNEAKIRCHAEGAVLASPVTIRRREAILKHVSDESVDAIFTGIHASFSDREFATMEGIPLSRLPISWSAGKPKDISNNCLAMMTKNNGTMSDVKCSDILPYVCYKKRTELTMTECGTYDTEYKLDARTGSCYKFHGRGLDWHKAFMVCAAEGGYLVVINSELELKVLMEVLERNKNKKIFARQSSDTFIGVRDLRDGGSWMTIHGDTLSEAGYDKWAKNQPDNSTYDTPDGEDCVSLYNNGLLNDIWCGYILAFLCEKKPDSLLDFSLD